MRQHKNNDDQSSRQTAQSKLRLQEDTDRSGKTKTLVICPILSKQRPQNAIDLSLGPELVGGKGKISKRDEQARLEEAIGLADAIDLDIVNALSIPVARPRPATLIGSGKADEIKSFVAANDIELVFVDSILSPVQQRNLEKLWSCKILDRTGLILEIFGARAKTREGRLQVELAHLQYQKSRLVRSWTHLERQRGGFGFLGGPGETQIEADRRMIQERISKIERMLAKVRRTRDLHRKSRKRVPYPIVALVGYTNAGKSTLFNRLTEAKVDAKDLLFATLDPTLRATKLPAGRDIILSDTVGFVSDLPHELVAAFRSTLEEVIEADLIVHVRDISHPDSEAQANDVANVLREIGIEIHGDISSSGLIEAWNKSDLLEENEKETLINNAARMANIVVISAMTGEGTGDLLSMIEKILGEGDELREISVEASKGREINWVYEHCDVLSRLDAANGDILLNVRIPKPRHGEFVRKFGN